MTTSIQRPSDDLHLLIRSEEGGEYVGIIAEPLTEAHARELTVDFPISHSPSIPIGEEVDLEVRWDSQSDSLDVRGRVASRNEDMVRHRYGFDIEPEAMRSLQPAISRRGCQRVEPDPISPGEVHVWTVQTDEKIPVDLRDISESGVSIRLRPEYEEEFYFERKIRIVLRLPRQDEPMDLVCWIRHRELRDSFIVYGLEYDARATEGFDRYRRCIADYVASREQEPGVAS